MTKTMRRRLFLVIATILLVDTYVLAAILVLGISTLATASLVFALSLRLRRGEIRTMQRIGGAPGTIRAVLATEIVGVLVAGVLLAAILTGVTRRYAPEIIRAVILS